MGIAVGSAVEQALQSAGQPVPPPENVLAVRLLFPNNVTFETTVIETPLQGQQIRCPIGRDVLSQGVLVYIGYSNLFSLSF